METLSKLFGSETKVKIMRLFLSNQEHVFTNKEISQRVKSSLAKVRLEMGTIEKMGLVKQRTHPQKKSGHGYMLNQQFSYLIPLHSFLINLEPLQPKEILRRINRIGSIKLIVVAGVFMQESESRADLLIVGDGVKKGTLENTIKTLEAEVGRELRYAYFTTEDFRYRLSMFDKLVRDILDYPHRKVLNRLGIA